MTWGCAMYDLRHLTAVHALRPSGLASGLTTSSAFGFVTLFAVAKTEPIFLRLHSEGCRDEVAPYGALCYTAPA